MLISIIVKTALPCKSKQNMVKRTNPIRVRLLPVCQCKSILLVLWEDPLKTITQKTRRGLTFISLCCEPLSALIIKCYQRSYSFQVKYSDSAKPFGANSLTLIYMGRRKICPLPRQFFAAAQKRLALDCWNFVAFIVSLLHIIWYTFWSPGTYAVAMVTWFLTGVWLKNDQNRNLIFHVGWK